MATLSELIKEEGRKLGFDAVGIARVDGQPHASNDEDTDSMPDTLRARLAAWLRQGYHGQMRWMSRDPERRSDPRNVLPGCCSIICVGLNYYTDDRANETPGHGRIARYAWGRDYHLILDKRLEQFEEVIRRLAPEARTRRYVDTGPVMEKAWAERAGLGWIGKHSNLVSSRYGSWLVLGEILTTLDLAKDDPGIDLCGSCRLCIRACPTGAIVEPYVVDARRCISYLTIELHGDADIIPDELRRPMGNRIFGCDDCLEACPYNAQATATSEPGFFPSAVSIAPKLDVLTALTAPEFAQLFRHSPVRRAKLHGLLRNIRVAFENFTSARSQP